MPAPDLDGEHGDALRAVDAVPDAQVPSVLGHHHVAAGDPLHVRAEAEQRGPGAALQVVQVELVGGKEEEGAELNVTDATCSGTFASGVTLSVL